MNGGGGMAACSRLCNLVTTSLLHYIEPKPSIILDKESEKDLLLSLSKVAREIKNWAATASSEEIAMKPLFECNCFPHLEQSFKGDHNCLANIVSLMVAFLGFDSLFVQHSAGNILATVSGFLSHFGSKWAEFLQFCWISLGTFVCSIQSNMPPSLIGSSVLSDERLMFQPLTEKDVPRKDESNIDFTGFIALLQSRTISMNLVMITNLFRVFRSILKTLKRVSDDLEGVFVQLAISSLLKIPWEFLGRVHTKEVFRGEVSSGKNWLQGKGIYLVGAREVLIGSVLQLFCSLVGKKGPQHLADGFLEELSMYTKFTNLLPDLLSSCFHKRLECNNQCLPQYLRHKMLVLMVRLSFHKHWQTSCALLWLKLLREYFGDLLYEYISKRDSDFENCLVGSPFLARFDDADKTQYPCTRHLLRHTILLFFKCCFTLAHASKETNQISECVFKPSSYTELDVCNEDCFLKGSSEFSEWLKNCVPLEKIVDYDNFSKSCSSFALSFLQLYIEDDSLLFEMLLQLLDAPFYSFQTLSSANDRSFEGLRNNISFQFSSIFSPIHTFHLFLLLVHYDHLVLIDYLISENTGVPCVKYLLRCLRMICNSWMVFVRFSICGNNVKHLSRKRKISIDEDCSRRSGSFVSSSDVAMRQHPRRQKQCTADKFINFELFINAKECLVSLKRTVENLHEKSLFPYNPKPLIRSLYRFEELCEQ